MNKVMEFLKSWQHVVLILGCAGIALAAGILVPDERWAKLGTVIARIASDPAGATAFVSLVAGAIFTLRGAWMRVPPALVLLVAGLAVSGCGASAPVVVAGVETGVHFTCQVAREVCAWTEPYMTTDTMREKHDAACSFMDTACHVVGAK